MTSAPTRAICERCRRPVKVCWCAHLPRVDSRTRVVFLQHPRERRVAIGTCWMAHLALANSELHVGVRFDHQTRIAELAAQPGTMVLFPDRAAGASASASDLGALAEGALRHLIVVDGTWSQARKLLERSPLLRGLPRLGFVPAQPSNYRIRREPSAECVSTIEAVVEVLGTVEQAPERFRPLLGAFEAMVDTQLRCARERTGPRRTRRPRQRHPRPPLLPPQLVTRADDLVALYVEANAWPVEAGLPVAAELIQLVAERVATGERFLAILAPRLPLSPATAAHLELPAPLLGDGEGRDLALSRFAAFLRPDDLLCVWGPYAPTLLRAEGVAERPLLDLRPVTSRFLRRRAGGIEEAATLLDGELATTPDHALLPGRAGRRLAALRRVMQRLVNSPRPTA